MDSNAKTAEKELPDDLAVCHEMIEELLETLATKNRQLDQAYHRISLLLQRMYGPRKERINPAQLQLFAETLAVVEPTEAAPTEDEPAATLPLGRRRGHGRQELPKDLLRIPCLHDLTEAEKLCPDCGQQRVRLGQEVSTQLDYQPASLFVLE